MKKPILILASGSPRRRKLLEDAGYEFEVVTSEIEETLPETGAPESVAVHNALSKARAVASKTGKGIVLGADTIVCLDGFILGKPADSNDALSILKRLAGTRHSVVTGVALVDASTGREAAFAESTIVVMREMSEKEIKEYVESGESLGKAGAYAIQETGDRFVEKIEGSLANVVGFPIESFSNFLSDFTGAAADE